MNVTISNLAWNVVEDDAVAGILNRCKISQVELAPTKIWPKPLLATKEELLSYRKFWNAKGIGIVALQSLLFGFPEFELFGPNAPEMLSYLKGIVEMAEKLGARVLVFGSPKNRKRGELAAPDAVKIAAPFFREIGDFAATKGICFCIEPNPTVYACDFVTTSEQGAALVKEVGSEGFGLHLDLGGMFLAEEPIEEQLRKLAPAIRHFHVSAVNLAHVDPDNSPIPYSSAIKMLKESGYTGTLSIEMVGKAPNNLPEVESSLTKVLKLAAEA